MNYKELKSEIIRIKKDIEHYNEEVRRNNRCDQHGFGFNEDSRFSGFKINLSLDSWLGYYGNSGCSTAIQCGEGFKKHFVKYLNVCRDVIMNAVIERMEDELKTYLDGEIEKTEQYLASLKENQN